MEHNTHTPVRVASRLLFCFSIIILVGLLPNSRTHADGKLRRVKAAIRKNDAQPGARPNANRDSRNDSRGDRESSLDRDDSDHDDHRTRHDNHRPQHKSHRSHGSRSPGFVFFSQPRTYIDPVVIPVANHPICQTHEQVIIHQLAAVQPVLSQPVYESVINESNVIESVVSPALKPIPQSIYELNGDPVSVVSAEPMVQAMVAEENGVGTDWFETCPSRFWATFGSDFDDITTGGLGLHLQSLGGLGLEGSVMTLRESTESFRDHLWIGDVNLVYEVLARGDARGRIGLGVNWLSDSWGTEAGLNLTAGFDLRLTDRVILTAEGDLGNLGDADFLHGRINLTRRFESCELMLGADYYDIGGAEVNSYFTGIMFRF